MALLSPEAEKERERVLVILDEISAAFRHRNQTDYAQGYEAACNLAADLIKSGYQPPVKRP